MTDDEFRKAIDLQARLMAGAGYLDYRDKMEYEAKLWPALKRENLRVALVKGRIVSTFRIFPLNVRIGCVTVPIGGINNVCTHPRHRKKGHMRDLLEDGIEHMRRNGILMSMLHGIPDFYYKFGYASVGCDYKLNVQTRTLTAFRKSLRVRKARQTDLPDMKRLYDETYAERTCALARDEKAWSRLRSELKRVRVIVDGSNRIRGYFWLANRRDYFRITEVCVENSEDVMRTLLAECGRLCRLAVFGEARFDVPPDHALSMYCRGCDAVMETRYKHNGNWMMRILDLDALFPVLEPELSRRLRRSHLAGWHGSFGIETEIGSVMLKVSDGTVRCAPGKSRRSSQTVRMSQPLLSQLLVGYRSGAELGGDRVPARLLDVLAVIFPLDYPFISPEDMF
jgi:predicted acetyltransferase